MKRARGFTLLELMVAITLMALLAGSLYGSLFAGIKAHRSTSSAVEPSRTAALALELLRQDFDAALPPNGVLAGAFIGTDGVGESDSLTFYSAASNDPASGSDIRKVDLTVATVAGETHPVLIRQITTNLLASNEPRIREQVLCRSIKFFDIRYYDGLYWMDTWDSSGQDNALPVAVEVTLEFVLKPEATDTAERTYRVSRIFKLACGAPLQGDALDEMLFGGLGGLDQ